MDSGSSLPSAVVETKVAIQTLMEHLVYPLLPVRVTSMEPPEVDKQKAVAKQMHAVVLLYNYYHRKQFPKLEILGFQSFCKVALTLKPSLVLYMKYMKRENKERDRDKQLSITERMILNACNICTSLDASKDTPSMETWPISKVSVFLVDQTKEKCLLQIGGNTDGVWSLVERNLEISSDEPVGEIQMKRHGSMEERGSSGDSGDKSCEIEDIPLWLAFYAVKQKTGIDKSSLIVLERHIAYSLSQEKATTRLYIMSYIKPVDGDFVEIPIKHVLSSLRGSLFMNVETPQVTPVVDCYHLLPYINILSNWFSRVTCYDGSLHGLSSHANVEPVGEPMIDDHYMNDNSHQSKQTLMPGSEPISGDHHINTSDQKEQTSEFFVNKMSKTENETVKEKEYNPSLFGSVFEPTSSAKEPDNLPVVVAQGAVIEEPCIKTSKNGDPLCVTVGNGAVQCKIVTCDPPLVPLNFSSEQHDLFHLPMSVKKNELLQSLRVLQKIRDELCRQQHLLDDEVAICEMKIQTILNEGEKNLTSNMMMVDACDGLLSSQACTSTPLYFEERSIPQTKRKKLSEVPLCFDERSIPQTKRKRLSEAVLRLRNPCQGDSMPN